MRKSAIILILYSTSLAFYGSLEMAHDLLHYLATHHHSHLHDHGHDDHHNIRHHGHGNAAENIVGDLADASENTLPSVINVFLYTQDNPSMSFDLLNGEVFSIATTPVPSGISIPPPVPPPWG